MYIVCYLDKKGILIFRYFKKYKYAYDLYEYYKKQNIDVRLFKHERIISL